MASSLDEGVLLATSRNQKWLLPWWWMNFRLFNDYPVTFVNMGDMSNEAIDWCQQKGNLISLDVSALSFVAKKEKIRPDLAQLWENISGLSVWELRDQWYKKPWAMLKTPYMKTIWMDSDCQVRGSLKPLFVFQLNEIGMSLKKECSFAQLENMARGLLQ